VSEIAKSVGRADFVAANTDLQAQRHLPRGVKAFAFGQELTKGLGCGMDDALGQRAAEAEEERIEHLFEGQDICVLVASLGGGTGSGASSVFAKAAKEAKCLTLGIFTMPFAFEGQKRQEIAKVALERATPHLNAYVVIPNENIFRVIDLKTPMKEAFSLVNKRLSDTLGGFIETLAIPGLINIDFADIKTLLEGRGRLAYLNSVQMQGSQGPDLALKEVLHHPLYDYDITGADRMVFNLTGDRGMRMQQVAEISRTIASFNTKAKIIFGVSFVPSTKHRMRIALFAVGCKGKEEQGAPSAPFFKKPAAKKKPRAKKAEAVEDAPKVIEKKKKKAAQKKPKAAKPVVSPKVKEPEKVRRNALDVKKAQDQEMKELEKKERQWDIPAFLRNSRSQEQGL